VRGEGDGVGWAGADEVGSGGCGGVGPVVFGFGVEVVGSAGGAGRGERSEWGRRLSEGAVGGLENAVVVDGGNVGTDRGSGLGKE